MSAIIYDFFIEKKKREKNMEVKEEKKSLLERKKEILKELRLSSLISSLTLKR